MSQITQIADTHGISDPVLNHVFLGDVYRNCSPVRVTGYHCCLDFDDTYVSKVDGTEVYLAGTSGIFNAKVEDKQTHTRKNGISTFFREEWSRQEVVDCIYRATSDENNLRCTKYKRRGRRISTLKYYEDPSLHIFVVKAGKTRYPATQY